VFAWACLAQLTVVLAYQKMIVLQPSNFQPSTMDQRPALFGRPPAGSTLTGTVVYGSFDNKLGCDRMNGSDWGDVNRNVIVAMFDRDPNGCHFVAKALNAQAAGAKAVIIADNNANPSARLPFMGDDGQGRQVFIPTIVIRKADAQAIKDALASAPGSVTVQILWDKPTLNTTVRWDFWSSSNDPSFETFGSSFHEAIVALGPFAVMTPWFVTIPGSGSGGALQGPICTNKNRYCVADPRRLSAGGQLDGLSVLQENLRRSCMWTAGLLGPPADAQMVYFSYIRKFYSMCASGPESYWNETCSYNVMHSLGVMVKPTQQCVTASGALGPDVDSDNTVFETMINSNTVLDSIVLPLLVVNDAPFLGSLDCPSPVSLTRCAPLNFICSGYLPDRAPPTCSNIDCPVLQTKDQCGVCGGNNACKKSSGISVGTVVGVLVAVVAVLLIAGFVWQRRQRAKMKRELDAILAAYMPMAENGNAPSSSSSRPVAPRDSRDTGDDDEDRLI